MADGCTSHRESNKLSPDAGDIIAPTVTIDFTLPVLKTFKHE